MALAWEASSSMVLLSVVSVLTSLHWLLSNPQTFAPDPAAFDDLVAVLSAVCVYNRQLATANLTAVVEMYMMFLFSMDGSFAVK
jgi:hypothetical protein